MDLLPRPPETFLGRDLELQRLNDGLARRHLFLLTGMAGIGKTSMALALLQRRRGVYLRCLPGGLSLIVTQANALCCVGRSHEAESILVEPAEVDLNARTSLASVYLNTGRYTRALEVYALALEGSDHDARRKCLNYLALLRAFRGELGLARKIVDQSLELAEDQADRAHALRISATVEALAGRYEMGLEQARQSFELARERSMARTSGLARFPLGPQAGALTFTRMAVPPTRSVPDSTAMLAPGSSTWRPSPPTTRLAR